jgi:hypothetical protein
MGTLAAEIACRTGGSAGGGDAEPKGKELEGLGVERAVAGPGGRRGSCVLGGVVENLEYVLFPMHTCR